MFSQCIKRLKTVAILFAVCGFLGLATLHAESFDPTRPPNLKSKSVPAPKSNFNPQDYQVSCILLSDQRKVAVINNQVVTVGDTVTAEKSGNATIADIRASEVTLSKARRKFLVRLPSSQYEKSAVSGHTDGFKDKP